MRAGWSAATAARAAGARAHRPSSISRIRPCPAAPVQLARPPGQGRHPSLGRCHEPQTAEQAGRPPRGREVRGGQQAAGDGGHGRRSANQPGHYIRSARRAARKGRSPQAQLNEALGQAFRSPPSVDAPRQRSAVPELMPSPRGSLSTCGARCSGGGRSCRRPTSARIGARSDRLLARSHRRRGDACLTPPQDRGRCAPSRTRTRDSRPAAPGLAPAGHSAARARPVEPIHSGGRSRAWGRVGKRDDGVHEQPCRCVTEGAPWPFPRATAHPDLPAKLASPPGASARASGRPGRVAPRRPRLDDARRWRSRPSNHQRGRCPRFGRAS